MQQRNRVLTLAADHLNRARGSQQFKRCTNTFTHIMQFIYCLLHTSCSVCVCVLCAVVSCARSAFSRLKTRGFHWTIVSAQSMDARVLTRIGASVCVCVSSDGSVGNRRIRGVGRLDRQLYYSFIVFYWLTIRLPRTVCDGRTEAPNRMQLLCAHDALRIYAFRFIGGAHSGWR